MIEVLILIAVTLIGTLLVLVRISLTLKGILEAMTAARGAAGGTSDKPAATLGGPSLQGGLSPQSTEAIPDDARGAPETLQDIAAVVAVAERATRQDAPSISLQAKRKQI